jgi:signal transduction histidine kinase
MNTYSDKLINVLLVDDNPTNLRVLAAALQGQGWRILMATDGESAIEQAEYVHPDLVLLDIMMPGIDGFETCQRLKSNSSLVDVPIIFMTALSESDQKVKGLELGAVDYITKPFQQNEVIARVKLHLQLSSLRHNLEQQVQERTLALTQSIQQLQQAQLQLVQSEKMSTLGQLVAGVGHEINNPINFLSGNLSHIDEYTQDLFHLLNLYIEKLPNPGDDIAELLEDIDLDYVREDMPKLVRSMKEGVNRLRDISSSLRTFARSDSTSKVEFQMHEGIESTLMLLRHRLKPDENHPEIQILKNYGDLPRIRCYPGPLNQVFMNLIANALDAFDDMNHDRSYEEIAANPNILSITTAVNTSKDLVTIRIQDNGLGMSSEVQSRIFEENFTTKPVGKGTGLGLAICYQIVVEKHGGQLTCSSVPTVSTEFVISLPVGS